MLTAAAGAYVQVEDAIAGHHVRVEHTFQGGEEVRIDCANETVAIDGIDARVCVTLGSDFFTLGPGEVCLAYSGCSSHECVLTERWV